MTEEFKQYLGNFHTKLITDMGALLVTCKLLETEKEGLLAGDFGKGLENSSLRVSTTPDSLKIIFKINPQNIQYLAEVINGETKLPAENQMINSELRKKFDGLIDYIIGIAAGQDVEVPDLMPKKDSYPMF